MWLPVTVTVSMVFGSCVVVSADVAAGSAVWAKAVFAIPADSHAPIANARWLRLQDLRCIPLRSLILLSNAGSAAAPGVVRLKRSKAMECHWPVDRQKWEKRGVGNKTVST